MKTLLRVLARLSYTLSWLILLGLGLFWVAEERGFFAARLEALLARELGPLGEGFELEDMAIHWFEPGLELRGLRLIHPTSGRELLWVKKVELTFSPFGGSSGPLEAIYLEGGRVALDGEFLDAVERWKARPRAPASGPSPGEDLEAQLPLVALRDVRLDLPSEEGVLRPLGRADLLLDRDSEGRMALSGRIQSGPEAGDAVHLVGAFLDDGRFEVEATGVDFSLAPEDLPGGWLLGDLPLVNLQGRALVRARAVLDPTGARPPTFEARGRISDTSFRVAGDPAQRPEVTDLHATLQVDFAPRPGQDWLSLGAWDCRGQLGFSLQGSPATCWVALGRRAGPGQLARAWVRLPDADVEPATLEQLGIWGVASKDLEAITPGGRGQLTIGLRVPVEAVSAASREAGREPVDVLVDIHPDGRTSATFHGWKNIRGVRDGLPLPWHEIRGHLVYARDRTAARDLRRFERFGVLGVEGRRGDARLSVRGLVVSPLQGHKGDLDLELEVVNAAIDAELGQALNGMQATTFLWPSFQPQGGTLDARFRLRQHPDLGGLAARGTLDLEDAHLTWNELGVPVHSTHGRVDLRWADHEIRVIQPDGSQVPRRPFGVAFDLAGQIGTAEGVRVRGLYRDDLQRVDRVSPQRILEGQGLGVQSLAVDLERLSLRGSDTARMAETWPELGTYLADLSPKGWADVRFLGQRQTAGAIRRTEVIGTPHQAEIQPVWFKMRTRDLSGRVRYVSEKAAAEIVGGILVEGEPRIWVAMALVGEWIDGVPVAATVDVAPEQEGLLHVFGAGLDPTDSALLGALRQALGELEGEGGSGPDLSALAMDGRLDVSARVRLDPELEESLRNTFAVVLRGNTFSFGDFQLHDLEGQLEHERGILHGERVTARLASTPVALSGARFLDRAQLDRLDQRYALLDAGGFLPEGPGPLVLGRLEAQNLPIDAEHLGAFVDSDTLEETLESFDWTGAVDVNGADFYVTEDGRGGAKVGVTGPIVPHEVRLNMGIDLEFLSGRIDIRSLIFEGGRARAWLEVEDMFGQVAGRHVDRGSMSITYVDGRLTIGNLDAELEGGSLASPGNRSQAATALALDLHEPYRFDLAVLIGQHDPYGADARVEKLIAGLFDSSVQDFGNLRGELWLTGSPDRLLDLQGAGWLALEQARLWSVPVARGLFSALGFDATAEFDEMHMRFTVSDGVVSMQEISVRSPLLKLVGSGTMDLNGELHHRFDVRYSLVDKLGPINRLIYWVQNSLLRVEIRGDMTRPQIFLRNGLAEMLSADAPWERRLPLPDFAPVRPRF